MWAPRAGLVGLFPSLPPPQTIQSGSGRRSPEAFLQNAERLIYPPNLVGCRDKELWLPFICDPGMAGAGVWGPASDCRVEAPGCG